MSRLRRGARAASGRAGSSASRGICTIAARIRAVAQLHEAEPVAPRLQAHRLGVDREVGPGEVGLEQLLAEVAASGSRG